MATTKTHLQSSVRIVSIEIKLSDVSVHEIKEIFDADFDIEINDETSKNPSFPGYSTLEKSSKLRITATCQDRSALLKFAQTARGEQ